MKTYLVSNPNAELGYELKIVDDNGDVTFQPIKGFAKDGSIHLDPSNPSGREWVTKAKFDKGAVDGQFELVPREKRAQGTTKTEKPTTTSRGWTEYLTEDELKVIEDLKQKAMARKQAESIKAKIAALTALLPEEEN